MDQSNIQPPPKAQVAEADGPPPQGDTLASLKPGTFRSVGDWHGDDPVGASRSDYSCIVYDLKRKRWLFPLGGGHGAFNPTNIVAYPKAGMVRNTLQRVALYASMTPEAQAAEQVNLIGFYPSTHHPRAGQHTYNGMTVIGDQLHRLTAYSVQAPMWYDLADLQPGGHAWHFEPDATFFNFQGRQVFTRGAGGTEPLPYQFPWIYVVGCCPTQDGRILIASHAGDFWGTVWLYDPAMKRGDQITGNGALGPLGLPPVIVRYPPDGKYYAFVQTGEEGKPPWGVRAFRLDFNAASPRVSVVTEITVVTDKWPNMKGRNSYDRLALSYDPVNKNIGGCVSDGFYHAFTPETREWKRLPLMAEAGTTGIPNQVFNCCARDPESNCLLVLNDAPTIQAFVVRPPPVGSADTNLTGQTGGTLTATLDFGGGKVARFTALAAKDLGAFHDPDTGIHQTCLRALDPAFPDWWVLFCPDVDGKRNEVIVGYGNVTATPANWMTPYTATIKSGANTLHTVTVPKHFTYAIWRWQSSPRPVVRDPATLKARGWIPNFQNVGNVPLAGEAISWRGPMTLPPHMDPHMGAPGDNNQIGLLTAAGASYMIAPNAAALETLRTEAESVGTWPVHFSKADGSMIDIKGERTFFSEFGGYGNFVVNEPPVPRGDAAWMVMDSAHQYASANAAWLLTGDPYFLRCMQGVTNSALLQNGYHRINQKLDGLLYPGQTRSFAWGLRDLSLLACTTPTKVPLGFQPRAKWKACLDDNRTCAQRYLDSPARVHRLFRVWTAMPILNTWMSAWLTWAVGMAVKQGFAEWRPVFDWSIGLQLAMTDNSSGWDRRLAAEYQIYPSRDRSLNMRVSASPLGTESDALMCKDWSDLLANYLSGSSGMLAIPPAPTGEGLASTNGLYAMHVRAALVMAIGHGTMGAQARYDWLHSEIMRKWRYVQVQFAIAA